MPLNQFIRLEEDKFVRLRFPIPINRAIPMRFIPAADGVYKRQQFIHPSSVIGVDVTERWNKIHGYN